LDCGAGIAPRPVAKLAIVLVGCGEVAVVEAGTAGVRGGSDGRYCGGGGGDRLGTGGSWW